MNQIDRNRVGIRKWLTFFGFFVLGISAANCQDEAPGGAELTEEEAEAQFLEMVEGFGWDREGKGSLGPEAEIDIPEGYRFTGRKGTEQLMKVYGNPLTNQEVGTLAPENLDWVIVFEFAKIGYVKDDEKDDLDPGDMLDAFKEGQKEANKQRAAMGIEKLYVDGWTKEPFYNEETNNLEWALRLKSESGAQIVNYKTKLLGRNGVMDSVLICSPEELEGLLPTYQEIIAGFDYKAGNTYAEYKKGDKVSEYGLKALMVGGGVFAAAKLGLFAVLLNFLKKGWILIVAGVVAAKSWIGKIFSRNKNQYTVDQSE